MKNKLKKYGAVLLVVLIACSGTIQEAAAQKNGKRKEARKEVRAYMQENVLPVILDKRLELDDQLNTEESETIAELRERRKALAEKRPELKAISEARKAAGKGNFEPTAAQKALLREVAKEKRMIATEAFEIIDNHEDFFIAMAEDLEDDKKTWAAAIRIILESHKPERPGQDRPGQDRPGQDRPGFGKDRKHGFGHQAGKLLNPVNFLLMDPENPRFSGEEGEDEEVIIYPNPAPGAQTITVRLREAGPVTITLLDASGREFKRIYSGNLEKGLNKIETDLSDLEPNQYMYRISTASGDSIRRLIVR